MLWLVLCLCLQEAHKQYEVEFNEMNQVKCSLVQENRNLKEVLGVSLTTLL